MAARLTRQEVEDLVDTMMHGVFALETQGDLPRSSWPREMRDWVEYLYVKLEEGELRGDEDADEAPEDGNES